jgi:protein TorT
MKFTVKVGLLGMAFASLVAATPASADDGWTFDILARDGASPHVIKWSNFPKDQVTKKWNICVLFPHMKNVYWVAGNYGMVQEANRDNISLQLFEAGGYQNLSTQLNQFDNCIANKYDAIVIAAISADGVGPLVKKAKDAGIPVIDYANGINSPDIAAHATVSFVDLGKLTGKYLLDHTDPSKTVVGFFPGPQGANFSDDAVKGFKEALEGSGVKIADTKRGDASLNVQLDLIDNALQAYPEMNYIVAIDPGAQGAITALRNGRRLGEVKVASINIIPPVYDDIMAGNTEGSGVDFTVVQARLAIDMALRILEKKELPSREAGPAPAFLTKETASKYEWTTMFAPKDFAATYAVEAK